MSWNSSVEDGGGVENILYKGTEVWNSMTCLGDGKEVDTAEAWWIVIEWVEANPEGLWIPC